MSDYGLYHIAGSQNVSVRFLARGDDGAKITGTTASDWTCKIQLDPDDVPSTLALVDLASVGAAHTDGGFIEVDTNAGAYRLDLPDSLFATANKLPYIRMIHADGDSDWVEAVVEKTVDTLADLDAAATRAALGLSASDLDTQLAALATTAAVTAVNALATAIKAKTDNLPASPASTGDIPGTAAIADAVVDEILDGDPTGDRTLRNLLGEASAQEPVVIPDPSPDADTCTVYLASEDIENELTAGIVVEFALVGGPAKTERMLTVANSASMTTAADGSASITLQRNDEITPSGTYYEVTCAALGLDRKRMTLEAASYNLASLIS